MVQTITSKIVTLNVTVTAASQSSQLQQSGAIVSLGGTTLSTNSYQFCGTLAAFNSLVGSSGNYTEVANMGATFFSQGSSVGVYVLELGIQSVPTVGPSALGTFITNNPNLFYVHLTPSEWDFTPIMAPPAPTCSSVAGGTLTAETYSVRITYVNPVGETVRSVIVSQSVAADFLLVVDSPAAEAGATGWNVYVGQQPNIGATLQNSTPIAIGTNWTLPTTGLVTGVAPPLVNTTGDAFTNLISQYTSPTAKTYFFGTTTAANISNYSGYKSAFMTVPSPNANSVEFPAAMPFYQCLANNPSAASPAGPMAFRYAYGVTAWPTTGSQANLTTVLSAYGNAITSASQGGISENMLQNGTTMDGVQFMQWYGIDWYQIQSSQALTATVINGSNQNPPLIYNQNGINTLETVVQDLGNTAIAFQLLSSAVVTATPFATYVAQNPANYQSGIYNGLAATIVSQAGFLNITFNIDAVQFAA
jgi:hypothetical protein